MVDISSGDKKINITVTSSGNKGNIATSPDMSMFYTERSREWAISDKLVNNEDYSSKYYANISKEQAQISTEKTEEVVNSGNTAINNINTVENAAITNILNQEVLSIENVNNTGISQINNIKTEGAKQVTLATNQANIAIEKANIATTQAGIATEKTTEVVESGNTALNNISNAKTEALNEINTTGAGYVENAEQYAQNSLTSANNAALSENNALSYKNSALESSQTATEQANIAITNANKATTSATNAKTSETNAKSSETRCEEILSRLGTAIKIKGRVDSIGDLPLGDNLDGDTYLVGTEGLDSYPEYYWYQDHWEFLGTSGTSLSWGLISGDITAQTDLQTALNNKQDKGDYALKSEIPTNNNQLTNGAGYQKASQVESAITSKGYQTASQVETAITNKGYATTTQLTNGLSTKQNTLTAGTGIDITNNVISNTQTSAEWGNIDGNIEDQTDLADYIKENSASGLQLFDTILKDHVLSFAESKGYALQGTYVYKESTPERYGYPDFYNKCLEEKTAGTATQTTLGGSTITTYNNSNGHIYYDIADKATIDEFFNTYGVCWMYGIDETNQRVFLPRQKLFEIIQNNIPVKGNGMSLGLINSKGEFAIFGYGDGNAYASPGTGLGNAYGTASTALTSARGRETWGVHTDATKSGLVADLTECEVTNKYLYIVVGNTEEARAIMDVTEITTSENDTVPLFTGQYFDFKPNNASWLKAGEQQNSGGIYTSCYNTLVNCLTAANNIYNLKVIETSEMVAGVDYSEYWKVNQDEMWFKTPVSIGLTAGEGTELYFKVANALQNLELLDAGEVLETLANKISRQDCKAYITEAYKNGTSWYRIWSDGWCEQGGISPANALTVTTTLLKSYSDLGYTVVGTFEFPNAVNAQQSRFVHNKARDSFQTSGASGASGCWFSWYVCGY